MLNRRILRTKAFKVIYSYAENPGMTLKDAEASLEMSCESTRNLYLFLLSVVGPLTAEARSRIEAAKSKFNPSEEELHPNLKFVNNRIAPLLVEDPEFNKLLARKRLSWEQYDAFLHHTYEVIRERKYFKDYLQNESGSLEEDARLWVRIYEHEFEDSDELAEILEDMSIYWNDDLGYALSWCCRSVSELGKGGRWTLPQLYQSDLPGNEAMESDKRFVMNIVRTAYANFDKFCESASSLTTKWNRDRICTTDLVLIVCGMAEAMSQKDTPAKIIINEYVEISKYYSTPESSGFVNGLLDKLINTHQ